VPSRKGVSTLDSGLKRSFHRLGSRRAVLMPVRGTGLAGLLDLSRQEGTSMTVIHSTTGFSTRFLTLLVALMGLWVSAPRTAIAQSVEWSQRLVSAPTARNGHAMAYDTARAVAVVFGGERIGGFDSETWEWNGTAWIQRLVSGPTARANHAMAYDSARGVTVLFGGQTGTTPFQSGETWEWNGTAWTRRMVSGPTARYYHAMAYDSARGVTVLFGGSNAGSDENSETWEWNGAAWTQRVVSGPTARYYHAMTYDAARGVTVLFGGNNASGVAVAETWEWNGTTWTQREVSGPSARFAHAMAYDSARDVNVLYGGFNNSGAAGDTWEWNGSAWNQWEGNGPPPRYGHAMADDAARGAAVLFGGFTEAYNDETWGLGPTPPTAAITSIIATGGAATLRVTIRYIDNESMDLNSVDAADVELRREGGDTIPALLVSRVLNPVSVVTAVYTFAAPGGAWDSTDNGYYSVWVRPEQVSDSGGAFTPSFNIRTYYLWFNNPTAALTGTYVQEGGTFLDSAVTYTDSAGNPRGFMLGAVGNGDVELAGPGGYLQQGSLRTGWVPEPGKFIATYRFPARNGYWDWTDNGPYDLRVRQGQVWDLQMNLVAPLTLRTYYLYFQTPNAVVTNTANVVKNGDHMQVALSYRGNNRTMNWDSLTSGDIELVGPGGYIGASTLLSRAYNATTNTYVVFYRIPARGGTWDSTDNGTYSLRVKANQVWDSVGNKIPAAEIRAYYLVFAP